MKRESCLSMKIKQLHLYYQMLDHANEEHFLQQISRRTHSLNCYKLKNVRGSGFHPQLSC